MMDVRLLSERAWEPDGIGVFQPSVLYKATLYKIASCCSHPSTWSRLSGYPAQIPSHRNLQMRGVLEVSKCGHAHGGIRYDPYTLSLGKNWEVCTTFWWRDSNPEMYGTLNLFSTEK